VTAGTISERARGGGESLSPPLEQQRPAAPGAQPRGAVSDP